MDDLYITSDAKGAQITHANPASVMSGAICNHWSRHSPDEFVHYPKTKPLGYLKQTALIRDAQSGNTDARNTVWEHNLRMVFSVANRLNIPKNVMDDVLQEGSLGILRAIEKFEIHRYGTLSTYAWIWIEQRMKRALVNLRFRVRIPSHLYVDYCRYHRERSRHCSRSDWFDWWDEHHENDPSLYQSLRRLEALHGAQPIDAALRVVCSQDQPSDQVVKREIQSIVRACLKQLGIKERYVLKHRYGIMGGLEKTLEQIGSELELTRERVRQLQQKGEQRMKVLFLQEGWTLESFGFILLSQSEAESASQ